MRPQQIEAEVVEGTYADIQAEFREMLAELQRKLTHLDQ